MILSGIINNLVSTAFTVSMIVIIFVGRKLWMKYGPKPEFAVKATSKYTCPTSKSKYTCPHCGETAVITPVHEESQ